MPGSRLHLGAGALVPGAALALSGAASAQSKQVTFNKDVSPIFQAKCQSCHEPGSIGPMSLVITGCTSLGPFDQAARRVASDAAMAYRPQHRREEVQERHVALRRTGRDDRGMGGWWRARR